MANTVLADLAVALASGAIKVVDLSVTLSADTPILELPEEFGWGKSWPFSKEEISPPLNNTGPPCGFGQYHYSCSLMFLVYFRMLPPFEHHDYS